MTDNNSPIFIEVNGVRFETLVPQPVIKIPAYGEITSVPLGVRITNVSDIPYRFHLELFQSYVLTSTRNLIRGGINRNVTPLTKDFDIPLIKSSEYVEYLMPTYLVWFEDKLLLVSYEMFGGFLSFSSLDQLDPYPYQYHFLSGIYQIQFHYTNSLPTKQMFLLTEGRTQVDNFWIGEVYTPFSLIEFQNCSNS